MDFNTLSSPTQAILREELALIQMRLQVREDDCRIAVAEAVMNGDDAHIIESLLLPLRELTAVRKALDASQPMLHLASPSPVATAALPLSYPKSYGLCVTIEGQPIPGGTDASTFAYAIQRIGCERVASLDLTLNHLPLVAREFRRLPHQRYLMQVEKRDGWYIITHCSTAKKRSFLYTIRSRLGVDLIAKVV